jgi:hypothetical protein
MVIKKDHIDCWNNQYDQKLKTIYVNISLKYILPYIDQKSNHFSYISFLDVKKED